MKGYRWTCKLSFYGVKLAVLNSDVRDFYTLKPYALEAHHSISTPQHKQNLVRKALIINFVNLVAKGT